jgi:hypothetical protein
MRSNEDELMEPPLAFLPLVLGIVECSLIQAFTLAIDDANLFACTLHFIKQHTSVMASSSNNAQTRLLNIQTEQTTEGLWERVACSLL